MRVAHLVTSGDVAGGQAIALTLARAARAAGHDVLFVAPTSGPFVTQLTHEQFETRLVDISRTTGWRGAVRLRQLLRTLDVDLLHTHVHVAAGVLGRLAGRAAAAAVVSHLHIENHFRPRRWARAPLIALDNGTARLCTRLLAVSDATRLSFERQGFPPGLLETVHNGIDVSALEAVPPPGLRAELGIPPDALVLGHVGRLAPVKGQRQLLEAFAHVRPATAVHVVLIGTDIERAGSYAAELEQLANSLGIRETVHFTGYRDNAAAAIQELDALVLPSSIEGLPLVVLEAMAHARPVVATAVGGTPEAVLDGETGLLVPPANVPALAAALERILSDADLRRDLGRAGRLRVAERFDAGRMANRVLQVYEDVERGR